MEAISYSRTRRHLAEVMDKVSDDREPVLITRQGGGPLSCCHSKNTTHSKKRRISFARRGTQSVCWNRSNSSSAAVSKVPRIAREAD